MWMRALLMTVLSVTVAIVHIVAESVWMVVMMPVIMMTVMMTMMVSRDNGRQCDASGDEDYNGQLWTRDQVTKKKKIHEISESCNLK